MNRPRPVGSSPACAQRKVADDPHIPKQPALPDTHRDSASHFSHPLHVFYGKLMETHGNSTLALNKSHSPSVALKQMDAIMNSAYIFVHHSAFLLPSSSPLLRSLPQIHNTPAYTPFDCIINLRKPNSTVRTHSARRFLELSVRRTTNQTGVDVFETFRKTFESVIT